MSILSLLLILAVAWILYHAYLGFKSPKDAIREILQKMKYGKSIALFALVTGILGQLIGFYGAFSAIEQMGGVSPEIVFGGIKVSMITTLYGISIFLFSNLLWWITAVLLENKLKANR